LKTAAKLSVRGVSLVETLVAATVAGLILGTIVTGGVTLQRTLVLANDYFRATSDEMLLADLIAADLRAAIGVSVTTGASGDVLTLTMPDYIDPATNKPRTPALTTTAPSFGSVGGKVDYVDPTTCPTVTYSVSAGKLMRTTATHAAVVSNALSNFQLSCASQPTFADVSVTFSTKFARGNTTGATPSTTVRNIVYMRNSQRF